MLSMHHAQHFLFTQEFPIVFFDLGVEPRIMVGLPSSIRTGFDAQTRLIQPPNAPRAGIPVPTVIASCGIGVAVANEASASQLLWGQRGVQSKKPVSPSLLEIGVDRHW